MKKTVLLLVIILCVPVLVTAQHSATNQGMNLVGGTAGFSSSGGDLFENTDGDRETRVNFNPSYMYFFRPGLAVGGNIAYSSWSQGKHSGSGFGIGPKVSYFLNDGPAGMIPYGSASFLFGSNSTKFDQSSSKYSQNYFILEAGMMYMVRDYFGITAGLYYKGVSYSYENSGSDSVKGNVFGVNFGLNTFIDCPFF